MFNLGTIYPIVSEVGSSQPPETYNVIKCTLSSNNYSNVKFNDIGVRCVLYNTKLDAYLLVSVLGFSCSFDSIWLLL